jgi:putative endonuclease
MSAYVYILRCSDDSYYVGSTRTTLEERLAQHNAGAFGGYTARRSGSSKGGAAQRRKR